MTVLIVSSFADLHARAVITALARRGANVELLDLADFPGKLTLTLGFGDGKRRFQLGRPGAGGLDMEFRSGGLVAKAERVRASRDC